MDKFELSSQFEEILRLLQEQKISLNELDALFIPSKSPNKIIPLYSALSTYLYFVEQSTEGAVVINLEGRILYVNNAFANLTQLSYEKILKKTFFDFFIEDFKAKIQKFLQDEKQKNFRGETFLHTNSDSLLSVLVSVNKIPLEDKTYCTVQITDISEQKTIEYISHQNELLLSVLEQSHDLLFIMDNKLNLLQCSGKAKSLIECKQERKSLSELLALIDEDNKEIKLSAENIDEYSSLLSNRKMRIRIIPNEKVIIGIVSLDALENRSNQVKGYVLTISDVTELEKSLEFTQKILNTIQDGYILLNDKGEILDVNPSYCRLVGYSKEELLEKNIFEMEPALAPQKFHEKLHELLKNGSARFLTHHKHKSGEEVVLDVSITLIEENGKYLGAAFCKDVTKQEALTSILKESESRYRAIFQNSPIPIAIVRDEKIWLINEAGMKVLKETNMARFSYRTIWDYLHPDDHEIVRKRIQLLLNGEMKSNSPRELKIVAADKSIINIEVVSSLVHFKGEKAIQIVFQDITEKKRSQKIESVLEKIALGVSHAYSLFDLGEIIENGLKELIEFDSLTLGLVDKSKENLKIVYASAGEGVNSLIPLEKTLYLQVIQQKKPLLLIESDIDELINEQKIKKIEFPAKSWLGFPLIEKDSVFGILTIQDFHNSKQITSRDKELFEALVRQLTVALREKLYQQEMKKFQAIIDQNPISVIITDLEGNIEYVNSFFTRITGYTREEVLGKNPRLLKSGKTPPERYKEMWDTIMRGEIWIGEFINKKKNGETYYENAIIMPLKDEYGNLINFVGLKEDITEKKEMQKRLIQTQKMEAIGQLVGAVAHDFNNLLTAINGYAELAMMKVDPKHPLYKAISTIFDAGKSASELTNQLLAFSRKQAQQLKMIKLKEYFERWKKIFKRLIPEDISLMLVADDNLPELYADPLQVEQVLLNLIINARDAIHEKENAREKRITVEAKLVHLDKKYVMLHPSAKIGPHILLSVSDTGVGIPKEIQNRIFDPFFTTKPKGKGTGMGLSTVYGIVKQNEGNIYVYSEVGIGTTFKIYWPVKEGKQVDETEDKEFIAEFNKPLSILLVEDDENVRNFLEATLEEKQYKVFAYDSPTKALHELKEKKVQIDIIITDLVMPDLTGVEFIEEVKNYLPDAKFIIISGYADNHVFNSGELPSNASFLQKPFSMKQLTLKINELIQKEKSK